jgi:hypothetical protein
MGLPIKLDCRYIPESWKAITANATVTDGVTVETVLSVYSRELEKNYCKCYCYC